MSKVITNDELYAIKLELYNFLDGKSQLLHKIGTELWQNPEIGLKEYFAHNLLTKILIDEEFDVTCNYLHETGFKAEYKTKSKPPNGVHVMLFCEYDALPLIGHACGHNLIASSSIGTGLALKYLISQYADIFPFWKVTLMGSVGEENFGGKITIIDNGDLNDVDFAMMVHPREVNSLHMPHYCLKELDLKFFGKSAHINSSPWEGRNALDSASLAYHAVGLLQKHLKTTWMINSVIRVDENQSLGIVPDKAKVELTVRCEDPKDMEFLIMRIHEIGEGAALMAGCTVEVEEFPEFYESLASNREMLALFRQNGEQFGQKYQDCKRSGGSTDMGNVSRRVASIHPVYKLPECEMGPHTDEFVKYTNTGAAHKATLIQAKIMAATALDIIADGDILRQIKMEFQRSNADGFVNHDYSQLYISK